MTQYAAVTELVSDRCVEAAALAALQCPAATEKCARVRRLVSAWRDGQLPRSENRAYAKRIDIPGRPVKPELIAPEDVPRRNFGSAEGRAALIHAIAHIEFNAINLALDCVVRFSRAGDVFVDDWLSVALEESQHYELLDARLKQLGYVYGDFAAHNGLWDMAVKTDRDLLARMALVPRLLEARGLDATPPIQAKLRQIGDTETLAILDIILRDEVKHVAIGDRWFRAECAARGVEPEQAFQQLLTEFGASTPRPPLNREARQAAGFSATELNAFEAKHLRR